MKNHPPTVVEFIEGLEQAGHQVAHKTSEIRINGSPVLVEKGSISVQVGEMSGEVSTVTLTLQPNEIHFRSAVISEECKSGREEIQSLEEGDEEDRNVMYVDVLPDMTKFREAFGLGVEGLGVIVQPGDRIGCPGHTGRINVTPHSSMAPPTPPLPKQ